MTLDNYSHLSLITINIKRYDWHWQTATRIGVVNCNCN